MHVCVFVSICEHVGSKLLSAFSAGLLPVMVRFSDCPDGALYSCLDLQNVTKVGQSLDKVSPEFAIDVEISSYTVQDVMACA